MMSISRRYQYSLLSQEDAYIDGTFEEVDSLDINENTKVVYQGIPGAYQEQAMVQYFGENVKNFSVPEFKDVVKTLDRGKLIMECFQLRILQQELSVEFMI